MRLGRLAADGLGAGRESQGGQIVKSAPLMVRFAPPLFSAPPLTSSVPSVQLKTLLPLRVKPSAADRPAVEIERADRPLRRDRRCVSGPGGGRRSRRYRP